MRSHSVSLLAAAALLALASSPAFAQLVGDPIGGPGGNGNGGANGGPSGGGDPPLSGSGGGGIAAPGPIAGAGLGYLVLVGGYYVVRRWRNEKTGE